MPIKGEAVFQKVFDLGGTLNMSKVRGLVSKMAGGGSVQSVRAAPEYVKYAAPVAFIPALPGMELSAETESGEVLRVQISARVYEVGALALMIRMPLSGENLSVLPAYNNVRFRVRGKGLRKSEVFEPYYAELSALLKPALVEIFDVPVEPEVYTAYCLTEAPSGAAETAREMRPFLAGLLLSETQYDRLSETEIRECLGNSFSYYKDDLIIADWDAAFVYEPGGKYEDLLYIFEVANMQLLALRKYDDFLDRILDKGYAEHDSLFQGWPVYTRRAKAILRELSEVRMDMAKVTDEIDNTAKFFGDWYVARVYTGLAGKLHTGDYRKSVGVKLATLNSLYESVLAETGRRQSLVLEIMVVLLIVFEVLMALFGTH